MGTVPPRPSKTQHTTLPISATFSYSIISPLTPASFLPYSWTVSIYAGPTDNCFLHGAAGPVVSSNGHVSGLRSTPVPPPPPLVACIKGGNGSSLPFCDASLPMEQRVADLVKRINVEDKANLLTARGHGGDGSHLQALPELGVPPYYWGTNCLHSLNQVKA